MTNNKFYSSLTVEATKPIDERLIVATATDLLTFDFPYENMYVFVRDEKAFYGLRDGLAGTDASHWSVISTSGGFAEWNAGTNYLRGQTVYVGTTGSLYYISMTSNLNSTPISNPLDWYPISGSTSAIKIDYTIVDNTVADGDVGRVFILDYSSLGADYPIVETWMNIWDTDITEARRVVVSPSLQLNRNVADTVDMGKLRVEFIGKIDDLYTVDTTTTEITGQITIR